MLLINHVRLGIFACYVKREGGIRPLLNHCFLCCRTFAFLPLLSDVIAFKFETHLHHFFLHHFHWFNHLWCQSPICRLKTPHLLPDTFQGYNSMRDSQIIKVKKRFTLAVPLICVCVCVRWPHCVDLFSLFPCPVLCSASAVFKGITLLCESPSSVGVCGSSSARDRKRTRSTPACTRQKSLSNDCPILQRH